MKKELLDVICCPACKGGLEEMPDGQKLRCTKCGKTYPVQEGIPLLLPDDADSR